jgi:hypothetical protein
MTAGRTQFDITDEAGDDMDLVHTCKNSDVAAFEQLRSACLNLDY